MRNDTTVGIKFVWDLQVKSSLSPECLFEKSIKSLYANFFYFLTTNLIYSLPHSKSSSQKLP